MSPGRKSTSVIIILRALGYGNLTGAFHFSNRRDVCGDRFHALQSHGVSGLKMKIYERSLQALLSSAPRSRVLARFASLAQIGELTRRLHSVTWCYPVLQGATHSVTGCYMVLHCVEVCFTLVHGVTRCQGLFPPLPFLEGKTLGTRLYVRVCMCSCARAPVYLRLFTCACVCARFSSYGLLPCVICKTVTCESRQKCGPYIVHGIKTWILNFFAFYRLYSLKIY